MCFPEAFLLFFQIHCQVENVVSLITQCCLLSVTFISHGFECLNAGLASAEQLLVVEPLNWPRIDHLLFLCVILLCINTDSSPLDSHQYVITAPDNKGTRIKKKPDKSRCLTRKISSNLSEAHIFSPVVLLFDSTPCPVYIIFSVSCQTIHGACAL